MPKLKVYQIRHVVQATRCDEKRVRQIFTDIFPKLDKPYKRKMSPDQYHTICKAITDPIYLRIIFY